MLASSPAMEESSRLLPIGLDPRRENLRTRRLNQSRTVVIERRRHRGGNLAHRIHPARARAKRFGVTDEIRTAQVPADGSGRITKALVRLDRAVCVIVEDDDHHWDALEHGSSQLVPGKQKAAVSAECDDWHLRPGQLGSVYEWTVNLTYPGDHEYTFYVDSTVRCKQLNLEVRAALGTTTLNDNSGNDNFSSDDNFNTSDTFWVVTATPTPDNNNKNNNSNDNSAVNGNQ